MVKQWNIYKRLNNPINDWLIFGNLLWVLAFFWIFVNPYFLLFIPFGYLSEMIGHYKNYSLKLAWWRKLIKYLILIGFFLYAKK